MDSFVDVAEVEVGDGRSASPIKIDTGAAIAARLKKALPEQGAPVAIVTRLNKALPGR